MRKEKKKSEFKRKGRRKEGKKNCSVVLGLVANEMVLTKLSYDADEAGAFKKSKEESQGLTLTM